MEVLYLKTLEILRDVLCEIQNLNNWWIVLSLEVHCRCFEYQEVKKQE